MTRNQMRAFDDVGARIESGAPLDQKDAAALVASTDLTAIGMLAESARQRQHGNRITFVRVASVPLADPGAWQGPFPAGAGELRITGRPTELESTLDCVRTVSAAAGNIPVSGFVLTDLDTWCDGGAIGLPALLDRLRHAGLQLIAEAPLDGLRDPQTALAAVVGSGLMLGRLTVTRVIESNRLDSIYKAAAVQEGLNAIRCFAPLPRLSSATQPSTGYDDVKQVALGRLLVHNIPSIQVDWDLHGPKLSQVALMFGADDLDAVPVSDSADLGPRRASLEEVRRNIRAASLAPVERNGRFEVVG